jgi:DNA modification methylase
LIYHSDNLSILPAIPHGSITLAYLDPPFFTQRDFGEYSDTWSGIREYIHELRKRVLLIQPLLSERGSMVLHLDHHASHYAKVMCDEIFGMDKFASEIVWRYRRWPARTPNFQRVHDTLLRYTVGSNPTFNQLYEPLAPSTQKQWKGKKQTAVVRNGKRVKSSIAQEESLGVPMGDVWDIGIIAPVAKERTGYPTQKPEALLERLILALTNDGDAVLDPYCGSGTTLAVALRLGRQAIGIDVGEEAIRTCQTRLAI